MDLEGIRKQLPTAHWLHNQILEEVDVAIEVGKVPSEFWALESRDQALIIARSRIKRTMEAYELHLSKEGSKK